MTMETELTAPAPLHCIAHYTHEDLELQAMAIRIANDAVLADVETNCPRVDLGDGGTWRDTRPMLDPREHAPQITDMARLALDYALRAHIIRRHPQHPHLVRQLVRN